MSKNLPLLLLLLLSSAFAQTNTHTFTFGKFGVDSYTGITTGCASLTTIDGVPADSATGNVGQICVPYNETPQWGLIEESWGFPNNGFLPDNTSTPPLSAPVFKDPTCTFKTVGCEAVETGAAAFVGYGAGVTVSVSINFVVGSHTVCARYYGCHLQYTFKETDGTGTATFVQ